MTSWRDYLSVSLALLLGLAVWVTAPAVIGQAEPWDAGWPYYRTVMIVGGFIVGLGARTWDVRGLAYVAVWVGQIGGTVITGLAARGGLALGVLTTGIGSLWLVPGLLLGAGLQAAFTKGARAVGLAALLGAWNLFTLM